MTIKLIAALVLSAASTAAFATPTFDVSIKGEAPVRVTVDNAGIASVSSKELAFNVPETSIVLAVVGAQSSVLHVQVTSTKPVMRTYSSERGDRLQIPGFVTQVDHVRRNIGVGQSMELSSHKEPPFEEYIDIKIARIE